jgi:hypothetical protein
LNIAFEPHAEACEHALLDEAGQAIYVCRRGFSHVQDEARMFAADLRTSDAFALQAGLFDERPGVVAGGRLNTLPQEGS